MRRFIVGHVTKDGAIAGPRLLEHLVDTVLYFEGESTGEHRILRAYKNRFGSIDEICVLAMHDSGLTEVANPSELFVAKRAQRPSGSCIVASIVGTRPVLIEVQALVGETSYGTPRRLANNLDQQRLAMILAVLERRAGMALGTHDVYASVAGGLRVVEPAADLGIALAIASSFRNTSLPAESRSVWRGRALRRAASRSCLAETPLPRRVNLDTPRCSRRRASRISRTQFATLSDDSDFRAGSKFSEGRNEATIDLAVSAAEQCGARVLHRTSDAVHHRSVLTIAGNAASVLDAAVALAGVAFEQIDLRVHSGVHPRIGALDVLPFVPLGSATMEQAVALAHEAGERIWQRYRVPSFYYGEAALQPERRLLADIRGGEFFPDVGDVATHPSAGAIAIGARGILVAFNVEPATGDLRVARRIAHLIRERSGGLRTLRALAFPLRDDVVQVSLNVTDERATPLYRLFEVIQALAAEHRVEVLRSELIGCVPLAAVESAALYALGVEDSTVRSTAPDWEFR